MLAFRPTDLPRTPSLDRQMDDIETFILIQEASTAFTLAFHSPQSLLANLYAF